MNIKNVFNYFCSFFRVIYVFESKKNNNKIKFNNFYLKKYKLASEIKNKELKNYLIEEKKLKESKKIKNFMCYFTKKNSSVWDGCIMVPLGKLTKLIKELV